MAGWPHLWQETVPFPQGCNGTEDAEKKGRESWAWTFLPHTGGAGIHQAFPESTQETASGWFLSPPFPFAWSVNPAFLDPHVGRCRWWAHVCQMPAALLILAWERSLAGGDGEKGTGKKSSILILQ